ncbi:hypothetical protein GCM10027074_24160 [Streptomyces deserti]
MRVAGQGLLQAAPSQVLDDRRVRREVRVRGVGVEQAGRADACGGQAVVRRREQVEARAVERVVGVGGAGVPELLVRERPGPRAARAGGASMSFVKRGVGFWVRRRCRRGASRTAR